MALRLNSNTLVDDYDWVWSGDAALDQSVSDLEHKYALYTETGDTEHLPIKPGQTPLVWRLTHLRGLARKEALDHYARAKGVGGFKASWHIASMVLLGVDGLKEPDGNPAKIDRVMIDDVMRVTQSDMDLLDANFEGLIEAIAGRALTRTYPTPK